MRRLLRALLFVAPFALTLVTLGWFLTQTPWAQPMVEKSAEAVRRDLSAALARAVTPEWLAAEMATALAAEDTTTRDILRGPLFGEVEFGNYEVTYTIIAAIVITPLVILGLRAMDRSRKSEG